jgi:hypothetical protein
MAKYQTLPQPGGGGDGGEIIGHFLCSLCQVKRKDMASSDIPPLLLLLKLIWESGALWQHNLNQWIQAQNPFPVNNRSGWENNS